MSPPHRVGGSAPSPRQPRLRAAAAGRFDEAIASYDKALAGLPNQPAPLYGRAITWAREGDKAKSQADAAAAEMLDPDIVTEFAGYGLTLQAARGLLYRLAKPTLAGPPPPL